MYRYEGKSKRMGVAQVPYGFTPLEMQRPSNGAYLAFAAVPIFKILAILARGSISGFISEVSQVITVATPGP
jgi:hypothetical protein